jgi:hypothetical protein
VVPALPFVITLAHSTGLTVAHAAPTRIQTSVAKMLMQLSTTRSPATFKIVYCHRLRDEGIHTSVRK